NHFAFIVFSMVPLAVAVTASFPPTRVRFRLGLRRCFIQEFFFLFFLCAVFRSFWIVAFHLQPFRLAQMTEMPDEMHQLPTVLSIAVIPSPVMLVAGKCRHAGKPRSEERRVGKECRSRRVPDPYNRRR